VRPAQKLAEAVAAFMHRGDGEAHGNARLDQQRLAELQAGLDRLGHGLGDARGMRASGRGARPAPRAMILRIAPQGAGDAHHLVDAQLVVHGDGKRPRLGNAAALEELGIGGIAVIDLAAGPVLRAHEVGVGIDREIGNLVFIQHRGHEMPERGRPASNDDAAPRCPPAARCATAEAAARWRSERVSQAPYFARKGMAIMVRVTSSMMLRLVGSVDEAIGQRRSRDDEAELAAGPSSMADSSAAPRFSPEQAGPAQYDDEALDRG